jgi:hypothetical protein
VAGVSVPVTEAEVEEGDVDKLVASLVHSAKEHGCSEPLADRRIGRTLTDSLGAFM